MQELLREYKESLNATEKLKKRVPEEDHRAVSGIIRDLEYAIHWMETGRMPGNYSKAIEKKDVYKNNTFWDSSIGAFISHSNYVDPFEEIENRIDAERQRMKGA